MKYFTTLFNQKWEVWPRKYEFCWNTFLIFVETIFQIDFQIWIVKLTWQKWLFEDNEISNTETDRKMNTSIIIIPAQKCDNISSLNIVPHHAGYYLHSVLVTSLLFDLGDLTCVYRLFIKNIPTSSSLHVLVYFFLENPLFLQTTQTISSHSWWITTRQESLL